jgi:hypothetical protein
MGKSFELDTYQGVDVFPLKLPFVIYGICKLQEEMQ